VFVSRLVAQEARAFLTSSLERTSAFRADQADVSVLGGALALERGLPRVAERNLKEAHTMSQPGPGPWQGFATQPLADAYLQHIRAARQAAARE
jgi:hypothetical protein